MSFVNNLTIRMFSYGGSGFKFLSKLLHNYIDTRFPDNIHPYISHNKPRNEFNNFDKIIFIYGDPRNAILSHIRRSDNYRKNKNGYTFGTRRFIQLSEPFEIYPIITKQEITVHKFLLNYPDYLDFTGFFKSWLDYPFYKKDYILFLKYEDIPNRINEIAEFVKLGKRFKHQLFNEFTSRRMDYLQQTKETQKLLNKNYERLLELQNSLPNFYVK